MTLFYYILFYFYEQYRELKLNWSNYESKLK